VAHSIAPAANLLLVIASSTSISDMLTAVDYATNNGANAVSMSWGVTERYMGSLETTLDPHFDHAGVTYIASTGDNGAQVNWPAVSSYVVSVGGTTLNINSDGTYISESAWSGSGGGTSTYVARPDYQNRLPVYQQPLRPDVSFDADPDSGVAVYCSQPSPGWMWSEVPASRPRVGQAFRP